MDHQNPHAPADGLQSGARTPAESLAPSAAGEEADEMALDTAPAPSVTAANAAVGESIVTAKANGSSAPAELDTGSNRTQPSATQTNVEAADVDMGETAAQSTYANAPNAPTVQAGQGPQVTPPDSPNPMPPASAAQVQTPPEDVEMAETVAEARGEGAAERDEEDVEGERREEAERIAES